jgi:hypothetical protein
VRVLPSKDEEGMVRMSGSREVSAFRANNPRTREYPVTVVGIYLNISDYGVCACGVEVRLGEGLCNGVKVSELSITSPVE